MWKDLAVAVLTIGHYGDQEYYYLGRSAEGLGFYSAAAINYGLSIEITRSGLLNCAGLFNTCDGLVLPRDAESRLARIPKTQKNENRPVLQEKLPSTPAPAVSANCNRAYADYFEKAQAARDREKAIALYRDGLAICPNDDVAHYELGKALADRKRYADAQKEFEAALRINPGFTDARKQLDAVRDTKKQEY